MRIEVTGDKEKIRPALDKFAEECQKGYEKTKEVWDKRLNYIKKANPWNVGKVEVPEMVFTVLDTEDDDKLIFFHSMPTPMLSRLLRFPIRKMEKNIEGYCKNIHGVNCKAKHCGD